VERSCTCFWPRLRARSGGRHDRFAIGIVLARWIGGRVFGVAISPRWPSFRQHRLGCGVALTGASLRLLGRVRPRKYYGRMMAPLVQVEDLEKRFDAVVLSHVSFEVESGEWIRLWGRRLRQDDTHQYPWSLEHPTSGRVVWMHGNRQLVSAS